MKSTDAEIDAGLSGFDDTSAREPDSVSRALSDLVLRLERPQQLDSFDSREIADIIRNILSVAGYTAPQKMVCMFCGGSYFDYICEAGSKMYAIICTDPKCHAQGPQRESLREAWDAAFCGKEKDK